MESTKIRIGNIINESLVNGSGIRTVFFFSGCHLKCHKCHNEKLQDSSYGTLKSISELIEVISANSNMIDGITISGGDPFCQYSELLSFCKIVKEKFPDKTIWLYTGRLISEIASNFYKILNYIDVLVDGPYIDALNTGEFKYIGSTNQRIIQINNK